MKDQSLKEGGMNEKFFFDKCAPKKFSHVTLEHCEKQPSSFHEYAKVWGAKPESVILLGDVGRGKTQFAFAMIREMFRRSPHRIWPRYYTSPELDSLLLEASRAETGDKFKIGQIGSEDLLFIDDFGREIDSPRAKRQYFEVLNLRYANLLPTMISTNLTFEQISHHMNDAIASRFQEFQVVEFLGPDLRVKGKIC
jgi:DNA replication protein DnaC